MTFHSAVLFSHRCVIASCLVAAFIVACGPETPSTEADMWTLQNSEEMGADLGDEVDAQQDMTDMSTPTCALDVHCARGEVCLATGQCGRVACEFCVAGQVCDDAGSGSSSCTAPECLEDGACPQPYEPQPEMQCQNDLDCDPGKVCILNDQTCAEVDCAFCVGDQVCYDNEDGSQSCSAPR